MPETTIWFYREGGRAPALRWLASVDARTERRTKAALSRLVRFGHELRRPNADLLRDGIHELRFRVGHLNHRLIYFFYEGIAVVISHHLIKQQSRVPELEIQQGLLHRARVLASPETSLQENPDGY